MDHFGKVSLNHAKSICVSDTYHPIPSMLICKYHSSSAFRNDEFLSHWGSCRNSCGDGSINIRAAWCLFPIRSSLGIRTIHLTMNGVFDCDVGPNIYSKNTQDMFQPITFPPALSRCLSAWGNGPHYPCGYQGVPPAASDPSPLRPCLLSPHDTSGRWPLEASLVGQGTTKYSYPGSLGE